VGSVGRTDEGYKVSTYSNSFPTFCAPRDRHSVCLPESGDHIDVGYVHGLRERKRGCRAVVGIPQGEEGRLTSNQSDGRGRDGKSGAVHCLHSGHYGHRTRCRAHSSSCCWRCLDVRCAALSRDGSHACVWPDNQTMELPRALRTVLLHPRGQPPRPLRPPNVPIRYARARPRANRSALFHRPRTDPRMIGDVE
jgi:hypothetical protein